MPHKSYKYKTFNNQDYHYWELCHEPRRKLKLVLQNRLWGTLNEIFILTEYNLFNINCWYQWGLWIDLDVDFREGGKPENQEKNPQSTGEINNSTYISSKFDNQHVTIPRWSPIQLLTPSDRLNLEFSGERQRANRIRHPWRIDRPQYVSITVLRSIGIHVYSITAIELGEL